MNENSKKSQSCRSPKEKASDGFRKELEENEKKSWKQETHRSARRTLAVLHDITNLSRPTQEENSSHWILA